MRIADILTTERYNAEHLPSSDDEYDALLQRNWRIHWRDMGPIYDMWDDDNLAGDIQDIFVKPTRIMAWMPEISGVAEQSTNEIEPEQEAPIDATEEQVIVADEQNNIGDDEQRRYTRRTRRLVERMGL